MKEVDIAIDPTRLPQLLKLTEAYTRTATVLSSSSFPIAHQVLQLPSLRGTAHFVVAKMKFNRSAVRAIKASSELSTHLPECRLCSLLPLNPAWVCFPSCMGCSCCSCNAQRTGPLQKEMPLLCWCLLSRLCSLSTGHLEH